MNKTDFEVSNALVGEIYAKLKENDSGQISLENHEILFEAGSRDSDNKPREATVEIRDIEGYRIKNYNFQFN